MTVTRVPSPSGSSCAVTVALALPVVLLVAGLHKQAPAHAEAPATSPIKVVRVTKVVRPVTVKRIVERAPVQQEYAVPAPQQATPAPVPPRTTEKPKDGRKVVDRTAPVEHQAAPESQVDAPPDSTPR